MSATAVVTATAVAVISAAAEYEDDED